MIIILRPFGKTATGGAVCLTFNQLVGDDVLAADWRKCLKILTLTSRSLMTCIQILLEKKGIDRGYFDLRRQIINCTLQLYYSDFQLNCIIVTSGKLSTVVIFSIIVIRT